MLVSVTDRADRYVFELRQSVFSARRNSRNLSFNPQVSERDLSRALQLRLRRTVRGLDGQTAE